MIDVQHCFFFKFYSDRLTQPLFSFYVRFKIVFRLHTTTSKADDSSASIFALSALETTESVATAHERDMVHWREIVADQSYQQSIVSAIAPAEELNDGEHAKPISRAVDFEESSSTTPSKATVIRPGKLNAKPKAMSASSFFGGKKKEATKSSTVGVTEKKKVTAVNSKENRQNTIKKSQVAPVPVKVGNADDFVADEEDSDDEEIKVVKKPAAAARVPKVKASSPAPSAPKPKSSPVRGAMDAFAEERPDIKRQRKRRKKLVEKTTMVGGYLRTETVTVWEDIPTDEENEEEEKKKLIKTKAAAISKPKKPENMKQKNMMSFFAPRK